MCSSDLIDRSIPLFFTRVQGTRIPITPQLIADVLQVPRIEFLDYPSFEHLRTVSKDELMSAFYEHLRTMSRDELMSAFCERPTAWGERLFTPCQPFY